MGDVISFMDGERVHVRNGEKSDGAKGAIKKASSLSFGRSIRLEIADTSGSSQVIKVNRGSIINFLNANQPKGVEPLKKGWRPFSKGDSDVEIQSRLLFHFNRWDELEAKGCDFKTKGKIKKAVEVYKVAALHSDSAISELLNLLLDYPKDVHFTTGDIGHWIESRSTLENSEELAQLCETYKELIEEMKRDNPTNIPIQVLKVEDLEDMAIRIRNKEKYKNLMKKDSAAISEKIYHLGGTKLASFDPGNQHVKLNKKSYFYEGVSLKIGEDEIFIYGNELKGFTDQWVKKSSKENIEITFQEFMTQKFESTPGLAEDLKKRSVYYFNDLERRQTTVEVVDGTLNQIGLGSEDDTLKVLKPGAYAYVIASVFDAEKEVVKQIFFAGLKQSTAKGLIQHSSFMRGGNVHTAGMIHINDEGNIGMITDKSGHYLPKDKEMAYTLRHLKDAGYDISTFNVNFTFKLQQVRADVWFNEVGEKLLLKILEQ